MSTLLKSFPLKTFLPIFKHLRQKLSIQSCSQLQPFIPGDFCTAVSLSFDHRVMLDNLSKLLKSFLLKRLSLPIIRHDQKKMSTGTFKIAQDHNQINTMYTNAPFFNQLQDIISLPYPFSAICTHSKEFTQGLFALLMDMIIRLHFSK